MSRACLAVVCCLTLAAAAPAAGGANKKKLVGTWELVRSEAKTPPGTTMRFTRDGKLKIRLEVAGKVVILNGTYSVEGDKVEITFDDPDGRERMATVTITKLTDRELHMKDDKGKTDQLRRKK